LSYVKFKRECNALFANTQTSQTLRVKLD